MGKKQKISRRNPVAKNSGKFNKAKTFRDKTKYSRKDKTSE
tara:strand:- start:13233 stop:13355 length:123 start_codon:yes stop_codon:yes gene_type:complete